MFARDDDEIAISYHESLLRRSDVNLLTGPYWLNDQIISFYMEYLERHVFAHQKRLFLFVSPEVTQCLKMVPISEMEIFLAPLDAYNKSYMFFALNDHLQVNESGGSHWSLLVFSRREMTFFHFDSLSRSNEYAFRQFANKLAVALGEGGGAGGGSNNDNSGTIKMVTASCLQQSNGFDCGIHVLCNIEHIADWICRTGLVVGLPPLSKDTVNGKRSEILNIIRDLNR